MRKQWRLFRGRRRRSSRVRAAAAARAARFRSRSCWGAAVLPVAELRALPRPPRTQRLGTTGPRVEPASGTKGEAIGGPDGQRTLNEAAADLFLKYEPSPDPGQDPLRMPTPGGERDARLRVGLELFGGRRRGTAAAPSFSNRPGIRLFAHCPVSVKRVGASHLRAQAGSRVWQQGRAV